jgi:hypothetical protein
LARQAFALPTQVDWYAQIISKRFCHPLVKGGEALPRNRPLSVIRPDPLNFYFADIHTKIECTKTRHQIDAWCSLKTIGELDAR